MRPAERHDVQDRDRDLDISLRRCRCDFQTSRHLALLIVRCPDRDLRRPPLCQTPDAWTCAATVWSSKRNVRSRPSRDARGSHPAAEPRYLVLLPLLPSLRILSPPSLCTIILTPSAFPPLLVLSCHLIIPPSKARAPRHRPSARDHRQRQTKDPLRRRARSRAPGSSVAFRSSCSPRVLCAERSLIMGKS